MATETYNDLSTHVPPRKTDDLLSRLADRVGAQFTAKAVFGEPVERDGVTVIPVATGKFGFGGGSGTDPAKGQAGEGGGGGGTMTPIGYIEIKDGSTRFVPVVHPARMAVLVGTLLLAGWAVNRR
jgi:uncharacterized spore protein YtfJ